MQVIAISKNIRISPTKVRLVTEKIKKLKPSDAINMLSFIPNSSALPIKKTIASAIANAKNNHGLSEETLIFKEIVVGKGPSFRRFRAIARGRAHAILKRTSNIKVVLEEEKKNLPEKQTIKKQPLLPKENPIQLTAPKRKEGENGSKS